MASEKQRRIAANTARKNFTKTGLWTAENKSTSYACRNILRNLPEAVCDEWGDQDTFIRAVLAEVGRRPSKGHYLWRRDPDNYQFEPGNLVWADRDERKRRRLEHERQLRFDRDLERYEARIARPLKERDKHDLRPEPWSCSPLDCPYSEDGYLPCTTCLWAYRYDDDPE